MSLSTQTKHDGRAVLFAGAELLVLHAIDYNGTHNRTHNSVNKKCVSNTKKQPEDRINHRWEKQTHTHAYTQTDLNLYEQAIVH